MLARSPPVLEDASKRTDNPSDEFDSEDERPWFSRVCASLYAKDAGLTLRVLTGIEERYCYRYASGETKHPPVESLVALLRSEHGQQWLNAAMEGCKARWWQDLQGALELSATHSIRRK